MKNISIPSFPIATYMDGNETVGNYSTHSTLPSFGQLCDFSRTTYKEILLAVFLILVICANLIGNSLVVYASALSTQLRKRKNTYFIISLACSDMGYAVLIVPIAISMKLHMGSFCHNLTTCYFVHIVDVIVNVSSILNLFIIAIDRFIAITMPFRYQDIVTSRRAKGVVAGCWIFAVSWSLLGIVKWGERNINDNGSILSIFISKKYRICVRSGNSYFFAASFIGVYLIPLITMSVTYVMVLSVAFSQIKAIETTTVDVDTSNSSSPDNGKDSKKAQVTRRRIKEWKATKSVAIVYVCFFMCWFPLFIINMIILFKPNLIRTLSLSMKQFLTYTFADVLPTLNTMMNPLIYSFSNKHFRQGFKAVFNKMLRKRVMRATSTGTNASRTFSRSVTTVISLSSINTGNLHANLPKTQHNNNILPNNDKDGTVGMENPSFEN